MGGRYAIWAWCALGRGRGRTKLCWGAREGWGKDGVAHISWRIVRGAQILRMVRLGRKRLRYGGRGNRFGTGVGGRIARYARQVFVWGRREVTVHADLTRVLVLGCRIRALGG